MATPVTGGGSTTLLVDEAALPGGTSQGNGADIAVGTLTFTAGSAAVDTFAFGTDLSGLKGDTDLNGTQDLFWVRVDATHLEARFGSTSGSAAIVVTLTPPQGGIAAGTSGNVTVTAHLLDNFINQFTDQIAGVVDLGQIGVVATDTSGSSATDTVHVSQRDDIPRVIAGTSTAITVYEDTLPGGNLDNDGNGTPDVNPNGHTATFTDAGLQALVNSGVDGPVVYRLRAVVSNTAVKDSTGQQLRSGGHDVYYEFADSGTESIFGNVPALSVLFGYSDGQDNGGAFDPAHDQIIFVVVKIGDGTFTFDLRGPVDHPAGSGDTARLAIDLSPAFAPADYDDDKATLNAGQVTAIVENDTPTAVADASSTPANTSITYDVLANDSAGADGGLQLVAAHVDASQGTLSFTAQGALTYEAATNFVGSASIAYTIQDADGDQSSATFSVAVTDAGPVTPVTGGGSITLLVDEAALPGGTSQGSFGDVAAGMLAFTAGSSAVNSFAFGTDLSALKGDTDLNGTQDLFWVRVDATHLEARFASTSGPAAITLTLTPPQGGIAAGASGTATVTARVLDNLVNPFTDGIAGVLDLGQVGVVATDVNGNSAAGMVDVNERDDMPVVLPGTAASVTVYEDALAGGNLDDDGNGTPDVSAGAHTATFTNAALQSLVNSGIDGPVVYRLRVAVANTGVVDSTGQPLKSGGHTVLYQFANSGTESIFGPVADGFVLFGYSDGQDNGGAFDPTHDRIIFVLTNNGDGTFTFDLRGPVDHQAGSGDIATLAIDLSPVFAPADYDDDKANLNAGQVTAIIENDVPTAVADASATPQNTPITGNVLTNDLTGGDAGLTLVAANVDATSGTSTFTADGSITFTPAPEFAGAAAIFYTTQDADGDQSSSAWTVSIAPPAPTTIAVVNDDGASVAGAIANDATPQITGAAMPGATIKVSDGTTVVGSVVADATTGAFTVTTSKLGEGKHTLSIVATNSAGISGPAATVALTVDTVGPLNGTSAADRLVGDALANTLQGAGGNDILDGGSGDDSLNGGAGTDTMNGGPGNDTYTVDSAGDIVSEVIGGGSDTVLTSVGYTLQAGSEIEFLATTNSAGTGKLTLTGNAFANTITGNAGANTLDGKGGADILTGLGGNDTYVVDNAGDVVNEATGGGTDTVQANVSYTLARGTSVETLSTTSSAGTASIDLTGNAIANTITGNAGNNVLIGGAGNDTLTGLGGQDTFAFIAPLDAATNVDAIKDFVAADDTIDLFSFIFTALNPTNAATPFALPVDEFLVIGAHAQDANDRVLYNGTTGALSYDADGSGSGAAVQFATLSTHPTITAADFVVG